MPTKIPPHATCVFKGEIFDVYQWPQKIFDGSTATFECLRRPPTVMVIAILEDGNIMYVEQEQPGKAPFTGLLGGRSERGEDPLDAVKREMLEEAGLVSDHWQLFFTHVVPGKIEWQLMYYIARNCKKVAEQHLDAGEKITLHTCTPEEFVTSVLALPTFAEKELHAQIFSALDANKAKSLIEELKA